MGVVIKFLFAALAVLALAEARSCRRYKVVVLTDTASHPAGLKHVVQRYQKLLGGVNNENNPGPIAGGQRSIDWDAKIVPFKMPFDFFDKNVTRGAVFKTKDNKFAVSNPEYGPPVDDRFDSLLPKSISRQFVRFSLERLFTPVKSNKMSVRFNIPARNKRARVRGFGAVFTDVDVKRATTMRYFDKKGCLIAHVNVPAQGKGLSFAGIVVLDAKGRKQMAAISEVGLKLGTSSVASLKHKRIHHNIGDVVVMDDFFYAEPEL